jgi:hypothetical protein
MLAPSATTTGDGFSVRRPTAMTPKMFLAVPGVSGYCHTNRRRACQMTKRWLVLGVLGLSAAGLAVAACSGDDNQNNQDKNGSDGGPDGTTVSEASTDSSSTSDSSTPDSSTPDSSKPDGSGTADAGHDAESCTGFDASALNDASVAAGFAQVWEVYRCYGCHQSASQVVTDAGGNITLSGNNQGLGDSGTIFPPNLTSDPATGLGC